MDTASPFSLKNPTGNGQPSDTAKSEVVGGEIGCRLGGRGAAEEVLGGEGGH